MMWPRDPQPHDWVEALPLGSGYVCVDCQRRITALDEMRTSPSCPIPYDRNWAKPVRPCAVCGQVRQACRDCGAYRHAVTRPVHEPVYGTHGVVYHCPCHLARGTLS